MPNLMLDHPGKRLCVKAEHALRIELAENGVCGNFNRTAEKPILRTLRRSLPVSRLCITRLLVAFTAQTIASYLEINPPLEGNHAWRAVSSQTDT